MRNPDHSDPNAFDQPRITQLMAQYANGHCPWSCQGNSSFLEPGHALMCVLPVEPVCHTLFWIPFPLLQSCFGASFEHQRASCSSLLVLLNHYLSFMEVQVFLKGATVEKLKTQECYFCSIFKGLFRPFRMLWLELTQFLLLGRVWYRGANTA